MYFYNAWKNHSHCWNRRKFLIDFQHIPFHSYTITLLGFSLTFIIKNHD